MKRSVPALGSLALSLLVAACSSDGTEGPAPFETSLNSTSELAQHRVTMNNTCWFDGPDRGPGDMASLEKVWQCEEPQ